MNKFVLLYSLIFLTSVASAQETWIGFKPAKELQLPFQNYVNNSIVQLVTAHYTSAKVSEVKFIDVTKSKEVTEALKLEPNADPTQGQDNLKAIIIETCRKQNIRKCPMTIDAGVSTGFFERRMVDGQQVPGVKLNTCRHSYHNWLALVSKANNIPIETLSPPLIIYSQDHKVLYNSATVSKDQLLNISFINKDSRLNDYTFKKTKNTTQGWKNLNQSDIIQFEFNQNIVEPQEVIYDLDVTNLSGETPVYAIGYPAQTHYFKDGKGDAPGGLLVASVGYITMRSPTQQYVQSNILANSGISGSPVFDVQGKITSIACSATEPVSLDQLESARTLSIVPNSSALEEIWAQLQF